jgi:ribulose-phosphate 3-epimerase
MHLLPSILSADFSRLGADVARVMDAGVRIIHVDVMDGHFVPNITIGPLVLEALAPTVHGRQGFFSVHLMIQHPERFVEQFANAGADAMSIHAESTDHAYRTLASIRDLGVSPGLALNPGSHTSLVEGLVESIDFALVMTVNPGFGGQKLISRGSTAGSIGRTSAIWWRRARIGRSLVRPFSVRRTWRLRPARCRT